VARGVAIAYAVLFIALVGFQRSLVFRPWLIPLEDVAQRPFVNGAFTVGVRTADGQTLKGFWKPPVGAAPVIVAFHGSADVPQRHFERFTTSPWSEKGYGVLAIAFRGFPGSSGQPSEKGLIEDGRAAYEFVQKHSPSSPVILHGYDLGTGVAIAVGAEKEALAVILDAPYVSLADVVWSHFPLLPTFALFDKFASDDRIRNVRARIFIVHGTDDRVIPIGHSDVLVSIRPDTGYFPVNGGDHIDILGRKDVEIEREISKAARQVRRHR